jgi:diguanylate cyclase (GGDEF)-like protein
MVSCLEPMLEESRFTEVGIAVGRGGESLLFRRRATPLDHRAMAEKRPVWEFDDRSETVGVSLPFPATGKCLACHHTVEGEALGTFGFTYDLSDTLSSLRRTDGLYALAAFALFAALLGVWLATLRPYRRFLEKLSRSLHRALEGDYSQPVDAATFEGEIAETARRYDRFLQNLHHSVGAIAERFDTLVRDLDIRADRPLERTEQALKLLANVHRYRYAVERNDSIFGLYDEIVKIVRHVTHAEHFSLYSVDRKERIKTLIYSTAGQTRDGSTEDGLLERLEIDEIAFEFPAVKRGDGDEIAFYFCLPIDIDEYVTLIVALFARDREALDRYRDKVLELRYYLQNLRPAIESRILTQKLREQSLLDGLTGLYNRKFLEEFLDKIDNQARRSQTTYAVLMLDIDRFKQINDTYGHDTGDRFIRLLGRIVQDHIRASDIAVRYGGEEFLVLLHQSTPEGAIKVAEAIGRDFASRVIHARGETIRRSVSIGIAFYPGHRAASLKEAIKLADTALYRAKAEGRDRVVVFRDDML